MNLSVFKARSNKNGHKFEGIVHSNPSIIGGTVVMFTDKKAARDYCKANNLKAWNF